MNYAIVLQPSAIKMLEAITDRRMQEKIRDRIEELKEEPEKKGKPLLGELRGYRSARAVGQRYRIIYRVNTEEGRVSVAGLGIRKEGAREDIYILARKLLRQHLI